MTTHTAISNSTTTSFIGSTRKQYHGPSSKSIRFLGRDEIGGRFSIIDKGPLQIQMEAGMVLHVHTGSVEVSQFANANESHLLEGERLVADHEGLLTVHSNGHAELQFDWPMSLPEQ